MPEMPDASTDSQTTPAPSPARRLPSLTDCLELLWWLVMLLMAIFGFSSLWWPLGADHGVLSYVGDVILAGGAQYVHVWDNNGPGAPLQHAFLQSLFGNALWPLHLLDLIYVVITLVALYALGRKLHSREAGMWSAALWAVWYVPVERESPLWCNAAQRDGWASMAVLWGIALIVCRGGLWPTALAGLLLGWATLFKPFFIVLAIPLALLVWTRRPAERGPATALTHIAAAAAATLVPIGLAVLFLHSRNALGAAYDSLVLFNTQVYQRSIGVGAERGLRWFLQVISVQHSGIALLGLVGAAAVLAGGAKHRIALALAYPLIAAGIIVMQAKMFLYHWHTLHAPLAALGGVGLMEWARQAEAQPRPGRTLQRAALCGVLFVALFNPLHGIARGVKLWGTEAILAGDVRGYQRDISREAGYGCLGFDGHREIAEFVARHSQPDDPVFVWGADPVVYHLAARRCATRFAPIWPIGLTRTDAPEVHVAFVEALMSDLKASPPALVVIVTRKSQKGDSWSDNVGEVMPPELVQYLQTHYQNAFKSELMAAYVPRAQPASRGRARR